MSVRPKQLSTAVVLFAVIVSTPTPSFAQATTKRPVNITLAPPGTIERAVPPLSAGRITGELILGFAAGVVGAVVGTVVASGLGELADCRSQNCTITNLVAGAQLGYTLVAPLGVGIMGCYDGQCGSLGSAYVASIATSVTGWLLIGMGMQNQSETLLGLGGVTVVLGPLVASIIGYNSERRYTPPKPGSSLKLRGVVVGTNSVSVAVGGAF